MQLNLMRHDKGTTAAPVPAAKKKAAALERAKWRRACRILLSIFRQSPVWTSDEICTQIMLVAEVVWGGVGKETADRE